MLVSITGQSDQGYSCGVVRLGGVIGGGGGDVDANCGHAGDVDFGGDDDGHSDDEVGSGDGCGTDCC